MQTTMIVWDIWILFDIIIDKRTKTHTATITFTAAVNVFISDYIRFVINVFVCFFFGSTSAGLFALFVAKIFFCLLLLTFAVGRSFLLFYSHISMSQVKMFIISVDVTFSILIQAICWFRIPSISFLIILLHLVLVLTNEHTFILHCWKDV